MNNTIILERENKLLKLQLENANDIIKRCKNWVGTDLGQDIAKHEAMIKGQRHNEQDWNMMDTNGEQGR